MTVLLPMMTMVLCSLLAVPASADSKSEAVMEALRWAKQAEVSGAAQDADWSASGRGITGQRSQGKDLRMDHFLIDIEEATKRNENFREVLFTAPHSQLVLMTLKPGEEIGTETHRLDQFIRVEAGEGTARLNGKDYPLKDGSALVIPAGTEHNIINGAKDRPLKLHTIYSPPEHKDKTTHRTKQDAEADKEDHFDGKTTAMLKEAGISR